MRRKEETERASQAARQAKSALTSGRAGDRNSSKRSRQSYGCITKLKGCVLFAEVRGLTQLTSRLEPNRLATLLEGFLSAMNDVALTHQAAIDHVIGDAMMLLYGLPRWRRDDCARAVRTAVEMQRAFLALHNRLVTQGRREVRGLTLRIGVASGDLVSADLASFGVMGRAVLGEVVTRAARLCAAAGPGNVLVDQKTYELSVRACRSAIDFSSTDVSFGRTDQVPAYHCTRCRSGLRLVPRRLYVDPVCHASIDPRNATRRNLDGEPYYFCSRLCAERFLANPQYFRERLTGSSG